MMEINGFKSDEIFTLYQFVESYERLGLRFFKGEKECLDRYPQMNKLKDLIKKSKFEEKRIREIRAISVDSIKDCFYFTKRTSKTLGALYHLRNSICHAKIRKVADKVEIYDYEAGENAPCNAIGILNYGKIVEIIDELNKIT